MTGLQAQQTSKQQNHKTSEHIKDTNNTLAKIKQAYRHEDENALSEDM